MVLKQRKKKGFIKMLTVHDFVDITENKLGMPVEDVVKMAKRHNNPKRDFLFVNTLLGKHIAVSGVDAIEMHQSLGDEVYQLFLRKDWVDKKVLLVGFAETATALAQSLMFYALHYKDKFPLNVVAYTQTTRENVAENDFINISFEEEHSHATTQKLYFEPNLDYDVVLFVEDEITTGNTILNFITQFEKYQSGKQYAVASILNWQNDADEQKFVEKGVETAYLVRGKIKEELPQFSISEGHTLDLFDEDAQYELELSATNNPRLPMTMSDFEKYEYFGNIEGKILKKILAIRPTKPKVLVIGNEENVSLPTKPKVLVIGTEENMFLPTVLASMLNADVKATTRSPIEPSPIAGYPISSRTILNSAYEGKRTTYLYNMEFEDLKKYHQFVLFIEEENEAFEKMTYEYLAPYGEVVVVKQKGLLEHGK